MKIENATETTFTAANGSTVALPDLFEGRKQLLLYQFMLYDNDADGCIGCSFIMDHIPHLGHLHSRDTTFAVIAPAPIAKINAWRERMGWKFPFYSSMGTSSGPGSADNNAIWKDFGIAVFAKDGDDVLNTYGTAFRGVEPLLTTYALLDMTPLGRQEVGNGMLNFRHHDRY